MDIVKQYVCVAIKLSHVERHFSAASNDIRFVKFGTLHLDREQSDPASGWRLVNFSHQGSTVGCENPNFCYFHSVVIASQLFT
jgi:hypothetical protein